MRYRRTNQLHKLHVPYKAHGYNGTAHKLHHRPQREWEECGPNSSNAVSWWESDCDQSRPKSEEFHQVGTALLCTLRKDQESGLWGVQTRLLW